VGTSLTFLQKIKSQLKAFSEAWCRYPIRTEHDRTLNQQWNLGMPRGEHILIQLNFSSTTLFTLTDGRTLVDWKSFLSSVGVYVSKECVQWILLFVMMTHWDG